MKKSGAQGVKRNKKGSKGERSNIENSDQGKGLSNTHRYLFTNPYKDGVQNSQGSFQDSRDHLKNQMNLLTSTASELR